MTTQKILSALLFIISSLLVTSCEESNLPVKPVNSASSTSTAKATSQIGNRIMNYSFDGTEGGEITLGTASGWVQNYLSKNPNEVKSHFFGASVIQKILSTSNCVGIRIYYSLDESGNRQMLLIGADNNGNDLAPAAGIKGRQSALTLTGINLTDSFANLDGDVIPEATSKKWISAYGVKNPTSLVAHFFGYEIVNQILSQTNCIGIRMYYALNDAGVQQILLVGVNNKSQNILPSSLTGRLSETTGDGTIGDISAPCPSYCSN